ncbi:MAG: porin family protein [Flavobacteriaceae bacterium]
MKKIILGLLISIASINYASAQIDFGIKGGLNYNQTGDITFESVESTAYDIISGAEAKTGYHLGLWSRFKIPILGLYLRPELVYTATKTEYTQVEGSGEYDLQKLDIPVLVGVKMLKLITLSVGPSFQYIINSEVSAQEQWEQLDSDDFSVGMQFGAGLEFGKLGLDLRYEKGLSQSSSEFIQSSLGVDEMISVDNRSNQWIISLQYKF